MVVVLIKRLIVQCISKNIRNQSTEIIALNKCPNGFTYFR